MEGVRKVGESPIGCLRFRGVVLMELDMDDEYGGVCWGWNGVIEYG